jgi:hypothetical protein
LIFHQQLQNEHSDFVFENVAQCLNNCALDDLLKLAADASVGAFNLLSDSGCYRFGSLNIRVELLDYDCLGRCRRNLDGCFDLLLRLCCYCVSLIVVQEALRLWRKMLI